MASLDDLELPQRAALMVMAMSAYVAGPLSRRGGDLKRAVKEWSDAWIQERLPVWDDEDGTAVRNAPADTSFIEDALRAVGEYHLYDAPVGAELQDLVARYREFKENQHGGE